MDTLILYNLTLFVLAGSGRFGAELTLLVKQRTRSIFKKKIHHIVQYLEVQFLELFGDLMVNFYAGRFTKQCLY